MKRQIIPRTKCFYVKIDNEKFKKGILPSSNEEWIVEGIDIAAAIKNLPFYISPNSNIAIYDSHFTLIESWDDHKISSVRYFEYKELSL